MTSERHAAAARAIARTYGFDSDTEITAARALKAADRVSRRKITTEAELAALLEDNDRSVVLTDVGGYVWWSEYTSAAGNILIGCASPMQGGRALGQTVPGWMNAMRPPEAIKYGPFTLIRDSQEDQP